MSDQIEKAARALCVKRGENPDRRLQDYHRSSFSYPAWEAYRDEAKAVLDATNGRRPKRPCVECGQVWGNGHFAVCSRHPDKLQSLNAV